ncbi:hypothetical protein [Thiolapillus sp.]|uniref:hypothetical protein n=1 Tax=Thiolapillus sp. TaxID=2017437 RepID=UPI003AF70AF8
MDEFQYTEILQVKKLMSLVRRLNARIFSPAHKAVQLVNNLAHWFLVKATIYTFRT